MVAMQASASSSCGQTMAFMISVVPVPALHSSQVSIGAGSRGTANSSKENKKLHLGVLIWQFLNKIASDVLKVYCDNTHNLYPIVELVSHL